MKQLCNLYSLIRLLEIRAVLLFSKKINRITRTGQDKQKNIFIVMMCEMSHVCGKK